MPKWQLLNWIADKYCFQINLFWTPEFSKYVHKTDITVIGFELFLLALQLLKWMLQKRMPVWNFCRLAFLYCIQKKGNYQLLMTKLSLTKLFKVLACLPCTLNMNHFNKQPHVEPATRYKPGQISKLSVNYVH